MEDLYKNDPNSWLRRTSFSNTVYHRPDPSQISIIPRAQFKLWHAELNSNGAATSTPVTQDDTSKASQSTTMSTLESNPDRSLTSKVHVASDSKTSKAGPASNQKALSGIFKEAKKTYRRLFVGPPSRERTRTESEKSSSRPKKESRLLKKYFDREVCPVSTLAESSEIH